MDQESKLLYCRTCSHHKFDANKGVLCSITNDKPSFLESCSIYKEDPELSYKKELEDIRLQMNNVEVDRWTRFANYVVDGVVLYILSIIAGGFLGLVFGLLMPDNLYMLENNRVLGYVIHFIVGMAYFTLMECTSGRTIGKLLTKTKVVNENGQNNITLKTGLIRSVSRFVPFDGLSFLGDNGWHDKWSNTKVVKDKK